MASPEQDRFERALESPSPSENLLNLASEFRDEGMSQVDVYFLFETRLQQISASDPLYDAIADTLDEVHGGPWAKRGGVFSCELTEQIIKAARSEFGPTG